MTASEVATRPPSRVLFASTLAFTMTASAFQVFALAILASPLIADLDLTRAQLGLIGSVNTAVGALSAPGTGRLTDRIGPRRSVLALLVLSALGMAMMAASPTAWWLALASAVSGIPQGWGNPATNSLIATRVEPGRRGAVTGIKQSGVTLGVFLSGAMLPVLERFWGWRGASLSFAVLFGLLALVTQLTLAPDSPSVTAPTTPAAETTGDARGRLDPFVWRLALFALLMGTAGGAVGRFFPLYAEEALGLSLAAAGLLTALGGLLGMAARVIVGRLAEDRIAPTRLLGILAVVGTAYCLLLAVLTPATRGLLVLSPPLSAVGIAAWNAVAMLAIIMFVPTAQSGRASGIVMLGFLGGLTISAPLAGAAVDAWGDYTPVWSTAAALTLAAAAVMFVGRAGTRSAAHSAASAM